VKKDYKKCLQMNHIFEVSLACLFCVTIEVSGSASEVGKNQNHTVTIWDGSFLLPSKSVVKTYLVFFPFNT
jgi:hypothetical protein